LAPHIGVSVRAGGTVEEGEAEGREGRIVTAIEANPGNSVDFVTRAGRGGAVAQLLESARAANNWPEAEDGDARVSRDAFLELAGLATTDAPQGPEPEEEATVPDSEASELREAVTTLTDERDTLRTQLEEAMTDLARYREAHQLREAEDAVVELVEKADVPVQFGPVAASIRGRVAEGLIGKVTRRDDGSIDEPALREAVDKAVEREVGYATSLGGYGRAHGLGGAPDPAADADAAAKRLEERFKSTFGLAESVAKSAVAGRPTF
jgi:hypothetical protein